MLNDTLKTQLQSYMGLIRQPIELRLRVNETAASLELKELAHELIGFSDKITLGESLSTDDTQSPEITISPKNVQARVSFKGVPLGHEFTSLVLALLQAGGHPSKEDANLLERIAKINAPMHFETFFSLSCHNCPDVVQALNLMASINPHITHTAFDGGLFQQEIDKRGIMGVPAVFVNGKEFHSGRSSLSELLDKIESHQGVTLNPLVKISNKGIYDTLIIGGGPAGAAAAVYAARKGLKVAALAERFGGQTQDTLGIENYISVLETDGPKFAADLERHARSSGAEVISGLTAERILPPQNGAPVEIKIKGGGSLHAKTVIIATGAKWREMGIPGEELYKNKGVAFCPHCDGPLFKGKKVAVVGGGNSGAEAAIDLAGLASHVTLLEYSATLKADAILQKRLADLPNVTIITQAATSEVFGDGKKVNGLGYTNRQTGESQRIDLDGIFVQIGLLPNTGFLRESIELTPFGEIIVDARGATSMPGVFAAGDATTTPYKQIIIAAGEGAKAALSAFEYLIRINN